MKRCVRTEPQVQAAELRMNTAHFLADLQTRDIRIWIDGDRLRCDAPSGVLTPELRTQLQERKAAVLEFLRNVDALSRSHAIVPLQPGGRRLPIFAVGGHNGDTLCFLTTARCLGPDQPFYGLELPGANGHDKPLESIEEIGHYLAQQILAAHPKGPYILAGYCSGGTVVFELARQLRRGGGTICLIALVASPHPGEFRGLPWLRLWLRKQWRRVRKHSRVLLSPISEQRRYFAAAMSNHRAHMKGPGAQVERATLEALARYRPERYPGPVHLFVPSEERTRCRTRVAGWSNVTQRVVEHIGPEGSTDDDILESHSPAFAEILRECINTVVPSGAEIWKR